MAYKTTAGQEQSKRASKFFCKTICKEGDKLMNIKTETLWSYYEDAKAEFQTVEKKEYSHQEGLSQCSTRKGCFALGKIVTFIKLIEEEAN